MNIRKSIHGLLSLLLTAALLLSALPAESRADWWDDWVEENMPDLPDLWPDPEPDPFADVETEEDWIRSFGNLELSGNCREDLVAVAETQLGYTRSYKNFDVGGLWDGYGYTRYGAWYGYPYADWCAMFVSFCIHYAGISYREFPYDAVCQSWINSLEKIGRFRLMKDHVPEPGDIVFFDYDDGKADHVGIVVSFDRETARLTTIEGNHSDKVEKFTYYDYWGIRFIQGYGILPEHIENPPKYELKEEPQPEPDAPEAEPVPEGTDPRAPIPLKPVQEALPEGAVPETPAPITP